MYLRSTPRRNKDGSEVRYLQLAHNVWDPQKRRSAVQVVYNFGREDTANREALQRLVASVARFLDPEAAPADGLEFTESRPLGGTWVLDALWARLGIGKEMRRLLKGRRRDESAERVLFALTANRALAPSSKLAASRWISEEVLVTDLPVTSDDACYRAMDWLTEITGDLERKVFDGLVTLLNLVAGNRLLRRGHDRRDVWQHNRSAGNQDTWHTTPGSFLVARRVAVPSLVRRSLCCRRLPALVRGRASVVLGGPHGGRYVEVTGRDSADRRVRPR
jgi:hypothetical protein